MRKKPLQIVFSTFFILLSATSAVKAQETSFVGFNKVEVATTPQGKTVYRLDYIYKFEGRDTVYIKELGSVPSQGHLIYFADEPKIEFRDPTNNSIIKVVEYKVSNVNDDARIFDAELAEPTDSTSNLLLGSPRRDTSEPIESLGGIDLPPESEFLEIARSERWQSPSTFQEVALTVLNKIFPLGIKPFQRDNHFFFVTPYVDLRGLPNSLRGQVALLISQPYERNRNKFFFRVQPLIREKRKREATWKKENVSRETQRAATNLINNIFNEFKKP